MLNIWARLEMTVAIIAAAIPALRPLWATSARSNQNQKNGERVGRSDDKQHPNSTYVMMTDQQIVEAGSLPSRLENPH
ncbi:hypothetical protein MMC29_006441 [Sticta canariensis]|nr:hypothetical protein [Sticta canariensis]